MFMPMKVMAQERSMDCIDFTTSSGCKERDPSSVALSS